MSKDQATKSNWWKPARFTSLFLAGVLGAGLVGCATPTPDQFEQTTSDVQNENVIQKESPVVQTAEPDNLDINSVFSVDVEKLDFSIGREDADQSYNAAEATRIAFGGSGASVEGSGASAAADTVTITESGTYILSGKVSAGQVIVDTKDVVHLVFDGVEISNDKGPAIDVRNAEKLTVTLEKGTKNTLSANVAEGAMVSTADVTINGDGALNIQNAKGNGIATEGILVITEGTFDVNAGQDALVGYNAVKIADGAFTIKAGGAGIKSDNAVDETAGFASIDDGDFTIDAEDGVYANTFVRVAGGDFDIKATDDAFESETDGHLIDGNLNIDVDNDAFHAEYVLVVEDGDVNIEGCEEGYEAEKVYITGSTTRINSADDAINASEPKDATETAVDTTAESADTKGGTGQGTADQGTTDQKNPDQGNNDQGASRDGASGSDSQTDRGRSTAPDGSTSQTPPEPPTDGTASEPPADGTMPEPPADGALPENGAAPNFDNGRGGANGGVTAAATDCLIRIDGGTIVITAQGDGIDSNGDVVINGGTVLVNGPTQEGNNAFDYDGTATVNGGSVIMVGPAGMAQGFTSGNQASAMANASGKAGDLVALTDQDGNVLASMTADVAFRSVLVSSPDMVEGDTYQVVVGGTLDGAKADSEGFADTGKVNGGTVTEVTAELSSGASGMGPGGFMGPNGTPPYGQDQGNRPYGNRSYGDQYGYGDDGSGTYDGYHHPDRHHNHDGYGYSENGSNSYNGADGYGYGQNGNRGYGDSGNGNADSGSSNNGNTGNTGNGSRVIPGLRGDTSV